MTRRLDQGEISLLTFKEGLLSRVAHDLRLKVGGWRVEIDEDEVRAFIPVEGIRVEGALKGGVLDASALSARDRATIETTLQQELLQGARFPEIRVVARWSRRAPDRDDVGLSGTLSLRGQERPFSATGRLRSGSLELTALLRPSLWGIAPYKALLGAIKLQDRVEVHLRLPGFLPA